MANLPTALFDQSVTFIMVADMARSQRFYEEILELPLVLVQVGGCRIYQAATNAFIGLCSHREAAPESKDNVILCLVSDQVDLWASKLKEKDIQLEKEPQTYDAFNIYHLMLRDPDGYLIEIQQFNDPAWPKP